MDREIFSYEKALEISMSYFDGDELAAKVFLDKYALRDSEQNLLESTPEQMHRRVASEIARIEKKKFKNPMSEDEIFGYLDHFKRIVPQGSLLYGIGNPYQFVSLSNCFVIDPPLDSYGSILKQDEELVQISKRRGGGGTDVSNLRPDGAATTNAAKTSTGIIPFMDRYSNSIREVGQSGRRGALLLSLDVRHPEILKFVKVKKDLQRVTGANLSVRLMDKFMDSATGKENEYELKWPVDAENPKISRIVDSKNLWRQIIENAHATGEPGLLFWDTIIRESPADCYAEFGFTTRSTNPCITDDMWISTSDGPKQVHELIGKQFVSITNGKLRTSDTRGFYKTGNKNVYQLKTKNGYTLKCTENHKIKQAEKNGRKYSNKWTELSNLHTGDFIVLNNARNSAKWSGEGCFEEGWIIGSLLGDGCFSEGSAKLSYWGNNKFAMRNIASQYIRDNMSCRSDMGTGSSSTVCAVKRNVTSLKSKSLSDYSHRFFSDDKNLKNKIETMGYDFCRGFISGWFDADGTVLSDKNKGSYSVRLSSVKIDNLKIAQRILLRLGVVSSIYENRKEKGYRLLPDGKGGEKAYLCQDQHELAISKDNLIEFNNKIGFNDEYKKDKLENIISSFVRGPYKEEFVDEIVEIGLLGKEEVYDCTIPVSHEFDANGIVVHNCGEVPLCPNDSCRLMLLNAYSYVINPFTKDAKFDYDAFYADCQIAQRFMDDIIDLELECIDRILKKIKIDPEPEDVREREAALWEKIKKMCKSGRRTGTGLTALADTLAAIGVAYASKESISVVDKIYKTLKLGCYRGSVDMAKELGAFPVWDHELEKNNPFLNRIKDEAPELYNDMKKYGRRNIGLLTSSPAGSVSLETQTSSAIEPVFSLSHERRKKINPNDKNSRVDFVDKSGDSWQRFTVVHPKVKIWMDITGETDISKSPWAGCCAEEIDWKKRIEVQSTAQKHIDHSISSTCNLPEDTTVETIAEIYEMAWKMGLKGITVYRKNSRDGVLVDNSSCSERKEDKIQKHDAPKRPKILPCDVHHVSVKGEGYLVLVGILSDEPYEVFALKNGQIPKSIKNGQITKVSRGGYKFTTGDEYEIPNIVDAGGQLEEALTRLVSMGLRHGADIEFIVNQLEKTNTADFGSFEKAIGRSLKKYIKDGTKVSGESCEICGNEIVREQGCKSCRSCGWSKCG